VSLHPTLEQKARGREKGEAEKKKKKKKKKKRKPEGRRKQEREETQFFQHLPPPRHFPLGLLLDAGLDDFM
jgi:hypothetical protein